MHIHLHILLGSLASLLLLSVAVIHIGADVSCSFVRPLMVFLQHVDMA